MTERQDDTLRRPAPDPVGLESDLLIAYSNSAENINNSIGNRVAVLGFASSTPHSTKDELLKLSYVLNKRERAERYFKEFHEKEP